jgi:hypothetical protein
MKYKYKICVMIGPFSMECGEGCISTLPWNLTVCDEKGVIWERNMQPGCVTRVQFPKCVNGTLIDVKRGELKFFYTCAGLINVDAALIMMDDCTVRHCMKYDSFVEDLITIMTSKGNISFLLKNCFNSWLWVQVVDSS